MPTEQMGPPSPPMTGKAPVPPEMIDAYLQDLITYQRMKDQGTGGFTFPTQAPACMFCTTNEAPGWLQTQWVKAKSQTLDPVVWVAVLGVLAALAGARIYRMMRAATQEAQNAIDNPALAPDTVPMAPRRVVRR